MKKLLLILWALLVPTIALAQSRTSSCFTTNGTNCVPAIQASTSIPINVATATTIQLIAGIPGKTIYITSFNMIASSTNNVTLTYGTGSSCSGVNILAGPYALVAQAGLAPGDGGGIILLVPAGNSLCIVLSSATQVGGSLSYAQF